MKTACEQEPHKYISQGTGSSSHRQHFSNFHGSWRSPGNLVKKAGSHSGGVGNALQRPLPPPPPWPLDLISSSRTAGHFHLCPQNEFKMCAFSEWNVREDPQSETPKPVWQGCSRDGFLQRCLHSHVFSQKLDKEVNTKGYKWSSGLQQWKCQN